MSESSYEPKELSPEELDAMRTDVQDKITVARVGMLLRHPFFGNMATRLKIESCDSWCPTAATDGRHLYYNTQFFNELTEKQVEFVIAHEIMHCVYDHLTRKDDRDPRLYNIASDYLVNNLLVRDSIGHKVTQIPIFQDFKYEGWTSEEVYDDLAKQEEENGCTAGENGELLDDHIDWTDGDDDGDDEEGKAGEGGSRQGRSKRPSLSPEDMKKIKDEIKESMIQAAQAAGAGNIPGEIKRLIQDLTEPKMNWREIIQTQIQSTIKADYTFSRPSRKNCHSGAILPGMDFDESIDVSVAIDMSGSISNEQARDMLSELKGIMDQYRDYRIKVWCFDTQIYNVQDFTSDNGEDITTYEPMGGGGTDFDINWTYMKQEDFQPKKFIMFTDGYPWASWGDPDYCDTIFVIHGYHDKNFEAPFGFTTHYDCTI
jgi:predicted metal-dependent peptidase